MAENNLSYILGLLAIDKSVLAIGRFDNDFLRDLDSCAGSGGVLTRGEQTPLLKLRYETVDNISNLLNRDLLILSMQMPSTLWQKFADKFQPSAILSIQECFEIEGFSQTSFPGADGLCYLEKNA